MDNKLDLDEVCSIADKVYWNVIDELGIESKCVEEDESTGGTRNTDYGRDLYYLIEDSVKEAINYKEEGEEDDEEETQ
jgi:hypothetical protein